MNGPLSSFDDLLYDLTPRATTITLAFDDPRIKPLVSLRLIQKILESQKSVIYLDFDLLFSSFLQNLESSELDREITNRNLIVMQPTDDILEFIRNIAFEKMKQGGALILDSLNSLQNLLNDDEISRGSKEANQKTALVVTVLQNMCRYYGKSLIVFNITKSRPRNLDEKSISFWEKTLVGGRMIRFKSDAILSVKQDSLDASLIEVIVQELQNGNPKDSNKAKYRFRV